CVPQRAPKNMNEGSSVYMEGPRDGDRDGDGILDGDDNCPNVFNPIRPMDMGVQPDFDADGFGDACDPCPLVAGEESCVSFDRDDRDSDGVANIGDNCPDVANPNQEDQDSDGIGDACDLCPAVSNPGGAPCPVSIAAIKTGEFDV